MRAVQWRVVENNGDVTPYAYARTCCGERVPTLEDLGLGRAPTERDIRHAIALSVSQICADISGGIVPRSCASFSELHDYVDANMYGGLCDDSSGIDWSNTDAANIVQDVVNNWLKVTL